MIGHQAKNQFLSNSVDKDLDKALIEICVKVLGLDLTQESMILERDLSNSKLLYMKFCNRFFSFYRVGDDGVMLMEEEDLRAWTRGKKNIKLFDVNIPTLLNEVVEYLHALSTVFRDS
eukprot:GDKJ01037170.1.p1 GENE.GDKJ01037170.1~~GDKJ01037170.1.p1  ORF type:complete len:118 (-),score=13.13 GDKJ01037170.1:43-396(-)